jgi:hypothetical protein
MTDIAECMRETLARDLQRQLYSAGVSFNAEDAYSGAQTAVRRLWPALSRAETYEFEISAKARGDGTLRFKIASALPFPAESPDG